MTLRARLILAFLVLAVVPLAAIVLYSYSTSLAAYRGAVAEASRARAEELNWRMVMARNQLDTALRDTATEVAALSGGDGAADRVALERKVRDGFAPIAPMVESFEFVPAEDGAAPTLQPRLSGAPGDERSVVMLLRPPPASPPPVPPVAVPDEELLGSPAGALEETLSALAESSRRAIEVLRDLEVVDRADAEAAVAESDRVAEALRRSLPRAVRMTRQRIEELRERRREAEAALGERFRYPVRRGDLVVGHLVAEVRPEQLLEVVLGGTRREPGEVAFARDREGKLYAATRVERRILDSLGLEDPSAGGKAATDAGWIVVESRDEDTGMTFGVARPLDRGLAEIRRTAVRNLAWGMALVTVAMLGILPLSRRMTRGLVDLTAAAGRLAGGDLSVRVPVRSRDELGRLAGAFNRMAEDLDEHQNRLLEQERQRREQAVERRLLEAENERRGRELEAARRFQLSLLPSRLPEHDELDLAVSMRTATEVGGDYYDFRSGEAGRLTATLGDATGHGVTAGTMVTVAKSLFSTGGDQAPSSFLTKASEVIRGMQLGRVSMAMLVSTYLDGRLTVSAAGMPPALVHRAANGLVEELLVPGIPLGAFSAPVYVDHEIRLDPGDTVLLMSDGFPELLDPEGEPLGYERAREAFLAVADGTPAAIIAALERVADRWRSGRSLADDMTFVVLRRHSTAEPDPTT